jgi:F0F1-type ATP synthase assembly protein I
VDWRKKPARGPAADQGVRPTMKKPLMSMVGEYTSLAFLLPVATFVGYAIGYLLDKAFGTHFLRVVFLILGTISGFVQLIRQVMRDTREDGS